MNNRQREREKERERGHYRVMRVKESKHCTHNTLESNFEGQNSLSPLIMEVLTDELWRQRRTTAKDRGSYEADTDDASDLSGAAMRFASDQSPGSGRVAICEHRLLRGF
ncbi:hypothetical protein TIFTF001_037327 [Ficus carica]|uniref:Uncharacterized protein n=1 Tax=Ficus carica TaxID=3494 RepID=A0AA88JC04_FICCA|nr:hypothetical protein TIFTF001_036248 [Ficus carica]GMN68270.1 hypothetical protein TIFTF001_037327 [Ficus carica]